MRIGIFLGLTFLCLSGAHADDLTTRDGTVYKDYKVLSHDAGYLTILYADGGGKIPLSNLPDPLQAQYGYNKAQSTAFVQASILADRQAKQALEDERKRAAAQRAAASASETPASALSPEPSQPASAVAAPAVSAPQQPGALTQDQVDAINAKIKELNEDIRFMQREDDKNAGQTVGAYSGKISDEQDQVNQLQAQLDQNRALSAQVKPAVLTPDQVAGIKEKMKELEDDIAFMQKSMSSGSVSQQGVVSYGTKTTGAYTDKIAEETDQLKQLQAQLGAN